MLDQASFVAEKVVRVDTLLASADEPRVETSRRGHGGLQPPIRARKDHGRSIRIQVRKAIHAFQCVRKIRRGEGGKLLKECEVTPEGTVFD